MKRNNHVSRQVKILQGNKFKEAVEMIRNGGGVGG